jgi:hypothetical protein
MLLTLSDMVTLVRLVQPEKAYSPMLLMLSGMTKATAVFPAGYVIKAV